MKTYAICPVSSATVNEHAARVGGLLTVAVLAIFLLTQSIWPILFLSIDFLLRAIPKPDYSAISKISLFVAGLLPIKPKIINAGPKIFAARVGFILATLSVISFVLIPGPLALVIAAVLALFSFLEGAFGICVACKLYPIIYKLFYGNSWSVN